MIANPTAQATGINPPAPQCSFVFNQKLDHILTSFVGLDLSGANNMHVKMFYCQGITSFYHFKVIRPRDFCNFSYHNDGPITNQRPIPSAIHQALVDVLYFCQHLVTTNDSDQDDPSTWTTNVFHWWVCSHIAVSGGGGGRGGGGGSGGAGGVPPILLTAQERLDISNLEAYEKRPPCDSDYTKLTADVHYPCWVVPFHCCAKVDAFDRVTDPAEKFSLCCPGANQELWLLQINFLGLVLDTVLKNPMGAMLIWHYHDDPCKIWFKHEEFQKCSPSSVFARQQLIQDLYSLTLKDFSSCHAFIKYFGSLIQNYDDISMPPLDGNMKVNLLQLAICHDKCLTTAFSTLK